MMLTLNLLPEKQKKNLGYVMNRRIIAFFGFGFFVSGVLLAFFLFLSYLFVLLPEKDIERAKAAEEAVQQAAGVKEKEEEIHALNRLFEIIIAREEKKRDIGPFFRRLLLESPAGIFIKTAAFRGEGKGAGLSGNAATRDDLLRFIETLRAYAEVSEVVSPISNIIKDRDIAFTLVLIMHP